MKDELLLNHSDCIYSSPVKELKIPIFFIVASLVLLLITLGGVISNSLYGYLGSAALIVIAKFSMPIRKERILVDKHGVYEKPLLSFSGEWKKIVSFDGCDGYYVVRCINSVNGQDILNENKGIWIVRKGELMCDLTGEFIRAIDFLSLEFKGEIHLEESEVENLYLENPIYFSCRNKGTLTKESLTFTEENFRVIV